MRCVRKLRILALLIAICSPLPAGAASGAAAGSVTTYPILLAWDPNPPQENVTSYRVWECPATVSTGCLLIGETAETTYTVQAEAGPRCWRATARNAYAESEHSVEACDWVGKPGSPTAFRILKELNVSEAATKP